MKRKRIFFRKLALLLTFIFVLNTAFTVSAKSVKCNTPTTTLNVAVYEYVPDVKKFETVIANEWKKIQPSVKLNFVDWDCYESDPAKSLDVFVFDSIFLTRFVESGYLAPFSAKQVKNSKDIMDFALKGCTIDGKVYGIPQILCTNLLFYRKGDTELDKVDNIEQLYNVLGKRTTTSVIPGNNEGLLVDLSGGTTQVCNYLDALEDVNGVYDDFDQFPELNPINDNALRSIKLMQYMAGIDQASYWPDDNDSYARGIWFKQGKGRAMLAYTETMNRMSDYTDQLKFKTISLSGTKNIPLFYGDIVGVNLNVTSGKKMRLAKQLANLMASSKVMTNCVKGDAENAAPQYLLPARNSNYNTLKADYPIYGDLYSIVANSENKLFRVGNGVREWLSSAKKVIPIWEESKE